MPDAIEEHDDFAPRMDDHRRDENDEFTPRHWKKAQRLTLVILIVVVCCLLLAAITKVRQAANRVSSSNNLYQIGIAFHNYDSTYGELPGNTYSTDGKPLLSWRVHLLPLIEEDDLYRQFKLDEPWDGANNIRLLDQMPKAYSNPHHPSTSKTYYRGFSNPGAVFDRKLVHRRKASDREVLGNLLPGQEKDYRLSFHSFKDLAAETILLVEAGEPVEWSNPIELDASPGKPIPPLGGSSGAKQKMQVLMANTIRYTIRTDMPEATLRALITHSGQETLPANWKD